jgi:alkylation response protein AidB-like acyl-CoA dehydrogenase
VTGPAAALATGLTTGPSTGLFAAERAALEALLPGLDKALADVPLAELEARGGPALELFRDAGGPGLLVPAAHGGLGAGAVDAVRVQRAVGTRSPSLAVATTMHHFSIASLAELSARSDGLEWAMLQAVAEKRWLMSSGFAEGRPGAHILRPGMRAVPVAGGLRVSGVKKPCSLTWSMDVLSASVRVEDPEAGPTGRLAVVLVPASSEGISRRRFWESPALEAAESDEVRLDDVFVDESLVYTPPLGEALDAVQARGFVWFELLVTASYVGVASALVERAAAAGRGTPLARAGLLGDLDTVMAALERLAGQLDGSAPGELPSDLDLLARSLSVRYSAERTIASVATEAAALLGGLAFMGSPDPALLLAAARPLAFHPPSAGSTAEALDRWAAGAPFSL